MAYQRSLVSHTFVLVFVREFGESLPIIFYLEHVETKAITVKLIKIINILSGTQLTIKQ